MSDKMFGTGFTVNQTHYPSHAHKWQPAGVVYYDDPADKGKNWRSWAVALVCECGQTRTCKLYEPD